MFRDEEGLLERSGRDFEEVHDRVITPFKGELERWYAANRSLGLYVKIILLTAVSVLRPGLDCLRFFPGAPRPQGELAAILAAD